MPAGIQADIDVCKEEFFGEKMANEQVASECWEFGIHWKSKSLVFRSTIHFCANPALSGFFGSWGKISYLKGS